MKGTLLFSLSLLAAATMTGARADSAAHMQKVLATKDLIGFWAFENNFQDATDHKNDAHAAGANTAMVTFGPGVNGGNAIQIDNTNDEGNFVEVNTPIGSIFDVPNITILYWAKPTKLRPTVDPDSGDASDDQWNSLVDRNTLWYTELNTVVGTSDKKARLVVRLYDPGDGSGSTPQIGREVEAPEDSYIGVNEWHQFAMTYDGKQVISYVDAKPVLTFDYDSADDHKLGPVADIDKDAAPNWNLTWGLWKQKGDHYTGLFDDTAYFSRALTADEIKGLYDAMLAAPPTAGN